MLAVFSRLFMVLALFAPVAASAQDDCDKDLTAFARLRKHKVKFRIVGGEIQILPGTDTESAKLALFLQRYQRELYAGSVGEDAPTEWAWVNAGRDRLYLGREILNFTQRWSRHWAIVHELVHLLLELEFQLGRPSPFYGKFRANESEVLRSLHQVQGYEVDQTIDEMRTFHFGSRVTIIDLIRQVRAANPAYAKINEAAHWFYANVEQFIAIAGRTAKYMNLVESTLTMGRGPTQFAFLNGKLYGGVEITLASQRSTFFYVSPLLGNGSHNTNYRNKIFLDQVRLTAAKANELDRMARKIQVLLQGQRLNLALSRDLKGEGLASLIKIQRLLNGNPNP